MLVPLFNISALGEAQTKRGGVPPPAAAKVTLLPRCRSGGEAFQLTNVAKFPRRNK